MNTETNAPQAGMMPYREDMREVVAMIKAEGFRVFMRHPSDTWCYYTDGTRIAYAQSNGYDMRLTTTHKANRETGTGFVFDDKITPEGIRGAIACHAPNWASQRDAASVHKWSSWQEFASHNTFGIEYKEV
jgi:hypothetical protein